MFGGKGKVGDGKAGDAGAARVMAEYCKAVDHTIYRHACGHICLDGLRYVVDRLTEAAVALGGRPEGEAVGKPDAGDLAEIAGDSEVAR